MDTQGLRVLVELADHGTLRAVAVVTGYSTSAVSQQLAALQRAMGAVLVEPSGRRLALTPAGRALLPRAREVLAVLDAARGDLDLGAPPSGPVRLAGYATALALDVVPAVARLREHHPRLAVQVQEREPDEVQRLLAEDEVDVGLVYEFSLAPRGLHGTAFGEVPVALVVPEPDRRSCEEVFRDPGTAWITNSRGPDDDELVGILSARFGATPQVVHRIDSLDLIVRLVAAGLGVALVAADGPRRDGVRYRDLAGAAGTRRGYAVTRPGRERWPANAALIEAVAAARG